MAQECCTPGENIMILPCSGGSNVGQLSNKAAGELTQEGFAKMFCLAGIGGHLDGFIQSAKDVPIMVVIDGCSVACAKAIMEHAEVPVKSFLVLTDLGIEKDKNFDLKREDIDKIKKVIKEACDQQQPDLTTGSGDSGPCSG
ncbi:MAG: putative zinc-binding protein [Proteobacteria bacterium]|nr:putative zinc-binding protein [Pseudomonadota bacterium]